MAGSHHVTDVGPYASITQHNIMYCTDYLFQFRVYIWGGTERHKCTGLPSKEDGEGWS